MSYFVFFCCLFKLGQISSKFAAAKNGQVSSKFAAVKMVNFLLPIFQVISKNGKLFVADFLIFIWL